MAKGAPPRRDGAELPPQEAPAADPWLVVGRIVAAQGLEGELRVLPRTDFPERFTRPGPRWLRKQQEPPRPVRLLSGRQLPGRELFVVRLEGIGNRSAAEAIVQHDLLVEASDRPPLAEGEFHLFDLQGLEVRLAPGGTPIGTVVDLIHAGNDLLEVRLSEGRRVLIPFVTPIVPRVEVSEGWLEITPPPGLLDP